MPAPETPDRGYMGDRTRGASLGRASTGGFIDRHGEWHGITVTPDARPMTLRRVRLDMGGYDQGGAYWGIGTPLYYFADHSGSIDGYVRGAARDAAKAAVRELHPAARFYR